MSSYTFTVYITELTRWFNNYCDPTPRVPGGDALPTDDWNWACQRCCFSLDEIISPYGPDARYRLNVHDGGDAIRETGLSSYGEFWNG